MKDRDLGYSPEGHGKYLGEYGRQKTTEGASHPVVRTDKSKQKFYSYLKVDKQVHKVINFYNWIKRQM